VFVERKLENEREKLTYEQLYDEQCYVDLNKNYKTLIQQNISFSYYV